MRVFSTLLTVLFAITVFTSARSQVATEDYDYHLHDDIAHISGVTTAGLTCPDIPLGEAITAWMDPDTATILTAGSWDIVIRNDSTPLLPGASIKIQPPRIFLRLQKASPSIQGYVSVSSTHPASNVSVTSLRSGNKEDFELWDSDKDATVITIQVLGTAFPVGGEIRVSLGGPGSGQAVIMKNSQPTPCKIAWDANATGVYRALKNDVLLYVNPGMGVFGAAYLHTAVDSGELENLRLVIYDQQYNKADRFSGVFAMTCSDPYAEFPPVVYFNTSDSGSLEIPVKIHSAGVHNFVLMPAADVDIPEFRSNPFKVRRGAGPGVYWGEFHYHSEYSRDATGTPGYFKGRNVANVDLFAPTEHSHTAGANSGLNCLEWGHYQSEAIAYTENDRFIPYLGYETSYHQSQGGHHNHIFYFNESNVETVPVFWDQETIYKIWDDADDALSYNVRMISIPHHTGKWFDNTDSGRLTGVSFGAGFRNQKYRRLLEIYSSHGLSELYDPMNILAYEQESSSPLSSSINGPHYAQDAWALGERLGIIASSDDHSSRGGTPRNPMFAVVSPELTRASTFEAMYNRHTYGTTGERILMSFTGNGELMGSEVYVEPGTVPELKVSVWGTDSLVRIDLLKWDLSGGGTWIGGHPKFDTLFSQTPTGVTSTFLYSDNSFSDSALYYVKVQQKSVHTSNGYGFAWSSPIWFLTSPCAPPSNVTTEVLSPGKVRLCWDPVPGAAGYTICGRVAGSLNTSCLFSAGSCKTLPSLNTSQAYLWTVQTHCAGGDVSPKSPEQHFAFTGGTGFATKTSSGSLYVYPNPTSDAVRVETQKDDVTIEVYDLFGRLVLSKFECCNVASINLSNQPRGWYLIRVADQYGNAEVKKVLRQ